MLTRTLSALFLACLLALPGFAAARNEVVGKGIYDGVWHGGKVKVIVERASADGRFSGVVHFDPHSPWPGAKFDFVGEVGRDGSLTMRRVGDGWDQVARTGLPQIDAHGWTWRGATTGDGLATASPFELRIPH